MGRPSHGSEATGATGLFAAPAPPPARPADEPQGENRQVTVLFVDLVNSTKLFGRRGQEGTFTILARFRADCTNIARGYHAYIDRSPGDGVVAFFGYPTAHEDHALQAVRTGLDIVEHFERTLIEGERLQPRVTIATGRVTADSQLVVGLAPVIAERLQKKAKPGTILVYEATQRLLHGHFVVEDVGSHRVKGYPEPIQAFRVLRRSEAASRFDALAASGLTPFTGRQRETEAVRAHWARALAGEGQALLLSGEPGIGKSRLGGVAREAALAGGHEVFTAQCSEYHSHSPLHPVVEMLEHHLGIEREHPAAARLARLESFLAGRGVAAEAAVPLMAALLSIPTDGRHPPPDLPAAVRRQRTLEVVADLLLHPRDGRAALLLVEDLHWADPSTLSLVETLVARRRDARALLVLTTRPETETLAEIAPHCTPIRVEALPRAEARAMVEGVVGGKSLPIGIVQEIIERTGGVPLFVEAVTRSVIESGVLREAGDHYELSGPLPPELIPATVDASLTARIDRLGDGKQVAQLAAALGREFSFELLHSVWGRSEAELESVLARMVELNLVSRSGLPPQATYAFRHALVQEVAYESLLQTRRQEVHRIIAGVLAQRFPELETRAPELLARHFDHAGMLDEAIHWWLKAGILAQERSAERECVKYVSRAIALLEQTPADDPGRIGRETTAHLLLFPALMTTLGYASREAEAACARARDLCQATGNHEGLLRALWGMWTVLFIRGDLAGALEAAESVMRMARAAGDPAIELPARHSVAFTHFFRGEFPEAIHHAEIVVRPFADEETRAMALERERALVRIFQSPSSVICLAILTQSLRFLGHLEQAERRSRELAELVEALAVPACTATGLCLGMYYDFDRRDLETVVRKAEEGYVLSVEGGFELWAASMRVYRGWARSLGGDAAAGLPEIRAGLDGYARTQAAMPMVAMTMMLGEALRAGGQPEAALEALGRAMRIAPEQGEHYYEPEVYRIAGEIQIELGREEEGEASLRRAVEIAGAQQARLLGLRSAVVLGRLLHARRRDAEARALVEPLYAWFPEGRNDPDLVAARELLRALAA